MQSDEQNERCLVDLLQNVKLTTLPGSRHPLKNIYIREVKYIPSMKTTEICISRSRIIFFCDKSIGTGRESILIVG